MHPGRRRHARRAPRESNPLGPLRQRSLRTNKVLRQSPAIHTSVDRTRHGASGGNDEVGEANVAFSGRIKLAGPGDAETTKTGV